MVDILQYADFDYYPSSANIEAVLTILSPLTGLSSLLIRKAGGIDSPSLNFAPLTPTYMQGLIEGGLRTQISTPELSSASQGAGLVCMQSQRDLSSSGTAYGLRWQPLAGADGRLHLLKLTSGLNTGVTVLDTVDIVSGVGLNTLQLRWRVSVPLGGTLLLGYHGTAVDFTDLTLAMAYLDASSPLSTSVTEGGFYLDGGAGFDFEVLFDQMQLEGA
jgi:hypothetical protein